MKEKYTYPQIAIARFSAEHVAAAASATMDDLNTTWKNSITNGHPSNSRMVDFSNVLEFSE